jgi:hypothetical protein
MLEVARMQSLQLFHAIDLLECSNVSDVVDTKGIFRHGSLRKAAVLLAPHQASYTE